MLVFSTKYFDEAQVRSLTEERIFDAFRDTLHAILFAAFYSEVFLKKFLKSIPKAERSERSVTFVLNGCVGAKLEHQIQRLMDIQAYGVRLGYADVKIYLNHENAMFHTKLFKFYRPRKYRYFVGSANLSNSAFQRNEELVLSFRRMQPQLDRYIENVMENSTLVSDFSLRGEDLGELEEFLQSGVLFYKPNTQLNFTFHELDMPKDVEERLSMLSERPVHTNPGTAWGAYNLKRAIKARLPNLEAAEVSEEKMRRLSISRWAIETCYGYWVPSAYIAEVQKKVAMVSNQKKDSLLALRDAIHSIGLEALLDDYRHYLTDVVTILSNARIDWRPDSRLLQRFSRYLNRLVQKLEHETFVERFCRPLVQSFLPEMWDDSYAKMDFLDSFCEFVEYKVLSAGSSSSLPVASMVNAFEITNGDDSQAILQKMEDYFKEYYWSEFQWIKPAQKQRS